MYRHPDTDVTSFAQSMETAFTEMNKDKYSIFIMGDFNIELLQYDTHNSTNDFLNSMISHSFLPYVLQPTRVTDHSVTIILTIFFPILLIMILPVEVLQLLSLIILLSFL